MENGTEPSAKRRQSAARLRERASFLEPALGHGLRFDPPTATRCWKPELFLCCCASRMTVKATSVPGVMEPEFLKIQMMIKLLAQSAQERSERSDLNQPGLSSIQCNPSIATTSRSRSRQHSLGQSPSSGRRLLLLERRNRKPGLTAIRRLE
jgi:hypothetical protein